MPTLTADASHPFALPLARYRYDAEGLLSGIRHPTCTRYRYWRDDRAVAESATRDSGALEQVSWLWLADAPLAEIAPASLASPLLLAIDASLSPMLEHADAVTNIVYAPHGHRAGALPRRTIPLAQLGFNGEVIDTDSDLYLLGPRLHRPYSPRLGLFIAPDTMSPFLDGGLNGLAYCEGDPINRADPTGNFWKWIMVGIAVVAAVASFGSMAVIGVTASAVIGAAISTAAAAVEVAAAVVKDELAQEVLGYVGIGLTAAGVVSAIPAVAKAGTRLASKGRQFLQRLGSTRPQTLADKGSRTALKAWPMSTSSTASQSSGFVDGPWPLGKASMAMEEYIDVVQAHGARFLTGAKGNVSGGKLASQIRKAVGRDHVFQRVELQSCRSAFGGKYASQAQRVADKLGAPTTGFQGRAGFAETMYRDHNYGTRRIMEPQTGWAKRRTALLNGTLSRLVGLKYKLTSLA